MFWNGPDEILYSDITDDVYNFMISGAEKVPAGCNGVSVIPKFYEELTGKPGGQILGLTLESTRDEIFRAILEALSKRLAEGKKALENAGGFKTESILCVGGGSKNRLWNQLRANYTGVPLKIIDQKESTVLGASLFVQAACGNASSPEEARSLIDYKTEIIEPNQLNVSYTTNYLIHIFFLPPSPQNGGLRKKRSKSPLGELGSKKRGSYMLKRNNELWK